MQREENKQRREKDGEVTVFSDNTAVSVAIRDENTQQPQTAAENDVVVKRNHPQQRQKANSRHKGKKRYQYDNASQNVKRNANVAVEPKNRTEYHCNHA
jgi:hypothetical protein